MGTRNLNIPAERVAAFQIPHTVLPELRRLADRNALDFPELLLYYSLENSFFPVKTAASDRAELESRYVTNFDALKKKYKSKNIAPYLALLRELVSELVYFPIPASYDAEAYMYGDSWGAARSYGGERIHQGTDILDRENIRGRLPVVSITDGTVKNLGWNELGGYRVGIVTEYGNYYYYAHLSGYAERLAEGDRVRAGQLLGFMGDSGYGKKEGTVGNFPTHLHVGIQADTKLSSKEFWINPYPFLRLIEDSRVEYRVLEK
jgi:murein DD-endopeptidase MepM/ murein hydrolase activator NlpD